VMDWYSLDDRSSGCGSSTVGNGLPAWTDLGNGGGGGGGGSSTGWGGAGVSDRSRGVECRRLATCSTRAAARAGSFLFLSISAATATRAPGGETRLATQPDCERASDWVRKNMSMIL
jgi:hypothetical protein